MPELAEVEFYRKQWDRGLGRRVLRIELHGGKRPFRGVDPAALTKSLRGGRLLSSESHGKQMLFRFSGDVWLGLHLGMTGKLSAGPAAFAAGKHDHLVLVQATQALVFSDPRQFGRVRFHQGSAPPPWWAGLPPAMMSAGFSRARVKSFLKSHGRLPIKAALLLQEGFPGIGNWMADEVLWRAGIKPSTRSGRLGEGACEQLWKEIRFVSRQALHKIGRDFSDPPAGWFFHERWGRGGRCPKHRVDLARAVIGGRTTAWCARCQSG